MALNLGDIRFGVGADTSGLSVAQMMIRAFGLNAAQDIQKVTDAMTKAQNEMTKTASAAKGLSSSMRGISDAVILASGPFGEYAFRIRAAADLVKQYGVVAGGAVAGTVGFGIAAFGLGDAMLHAVIGLQQAEVTFKAITGSSTVAAGQIAFVRDVANKAGLQFNETALSFSRFEAAATATHQSLSVTNDEFTKLALISGTLHLGVQQSGNAIRTLDEIMSQGYVQTRNVVRQLANELPGAMDISKVAAAAMTGQLEMTGAAFQKMLASKQVSGPEFIKAFLDAYSEFIHLDPSKPIDTLQAAINRMGNSWNFLLTSLSDATGAANMFKAAFNALSSTFDDIRTHMGSVLQVIGAIAGAVAGAIVGLATFAAVSAAIGAATAAWYGMLTVIAAVRGSVYALIAVQTALNAVMTANPIALLIKLLVSLAAAIFGARLAMDIMHKALADNNTAMKDDGAIQGYIDSQKGLQNQVEATTAAYMKQAEAIQASQKSALDNALSQMKADDEDLKRKSQLGQQLWGGQHKDQFGRSGFDMSGATAAAAKLKEDAASTELIAKNLSNANAQMMALAAIQRKPDDRTIGKGSPGDATHKGPNPYSGTSEIEKMITEAKAAQDQIRALLANPTGDSKLIEDLAKANEALYGISHSKDSAAQLAVVAGLLNKAGDSSVHAGDSVQKLAQHLSTFITNARVAKEVLAGWTSVQETLTKAMAANASEQERIDILMKGGDPDANSSAKNLTQATEYIAKLHGNKDLVAALTAQLKDLGFEGTDVTHALASMFQKAQDGKDFEKTLGELNKTLDDTRNGIETMKATTAQSLLDIGYLQEAKAALKGLGDDDLANVEAWMKKIGIATGNATADYATFLKKIGDANKAVEDHKAAIEQVNKDWNKWADNSIDDIMKVLDKTMTLREATHDILHSFLQTFISTAFVDPLKQAVHTFISHSVSSFSALGGNSGQIAAQTSLISSTAATTTAMISLAGAATAAATALAANAGSNMAGGLTTIGATLTSVLALAGGGRVYGPGTSISDSIPAMLSDGEFIVNADATRKNLSLLHMINSGSVARMSGGGQVGGGLFVPTGNGGSSGGSGNGGSHSTVIDGRTFVDARGATPDAVQMLRQELLAHQARLQARIPEMIDHRTLEGRIRGRPGY